MHPSHYLVYYFRNVHVIALHYDGIAMMIMTLSVQMSIIYKQLMSAHKVIDIVSLDILTLCLYFIYSIFANMK